MFEYFLIFIFGTALGFAFAWIFSYSKLHKRPNGKPQRITDTLTIPQYIPEAETSRHKKRDELEATNYKKDFMNKENLLKKMVDSFYCRFARRGGEEDGSVKIGAVCFWGKAESGFYLHTITSSYSVSENSFIPIDNKYFSKEEFVWSEGNGENPLNIYTSELLKIRYSAGAAVSSDGTLWGYLTMDTPDEFGDNAIIELRNLAQLIADVFRVLRENNSVNARNNLFLGISSELQNILSLSSKENVLLSISRMLESNFKFNRFMLIAPETVNAAQNLNADSDGETMWHICDAIGESSENLKQISFVPSEKCLLKDLFLRNVSVVIKNEIASDPYQCRLYKDEPRDFNLHSLFAVMPPVTGDFYPIAIVLESENKSAVSKTEARILSYVATCVGLKLYEIANRDCNDEAERNDAVDFSGLGELSNYYKNEILSVKDSLDSIGFFLVKFADGATNLSAGDAAVFLDFAKSQKKDWENARLATLGEGEFIFSMRGNFSEETFNYNADQTAKKMSSAFALKIETLKIWADKQKIFAKEEELGADYSDMLFVKTLQYFMENDQKPPFNDSGNKSAADGE